jgi:hypothetical protein
MIVSFAKRTDMVNDPIFFFSPEKLQQLAINHREAYKTAQPFAHIVLDGLLPDHVLEPVLTEFPGPELPEWHKFNNPREKKLACQDENQMGPHTRHLISQLNSATFLNFIEVMTGIEGLVPDPYLHGGGLHQIMRGGHLNIHADFNWHRKMKLERRLNLLLYLNKEWNEEYGGHLELWDKSMKKCEKKILPVFNRCVIFNTTDTAYHGHPEPLTCPENRSRKSLALYYYTSRSAAMESSEMHPTMFQARPGDGRFVRMKLGGKYLVRKMTPPVIFDLKRLMERRLEKNNPT